MDQQQFRTNLRGLLSSRGLTRKDAAIFIDLNERWLRRVCSTGVTRVESRNREQLQKICDYFGIERIVELWSRQLLTRSNESNAQSEAYVAKVSELLQSCNTAQRKSLCSFIDSVHRSHRATRLISKFRQDHPLHFAACKHRFGSDTELQAEIERRLEEGESEATICNELIEMGVAARKITSEKPDQITTPSPDSTPPKRRASTIQEMLIARRGPDRNAFDGLDPARFEK